MQAHTRNLIEHTSLVFPIAQYRVLPSEPRQVSIFAKASQQRDRFNFLLPHPHT